MPEDDKTPAPQTAPTPTTISLPPGKWFLKLAKGNGQEVGSFEVEGPLTLTVIVTHG